MEQFLLFIIVAIVSLLFNRSKMNSQKQSDQRPNTRRDISESQPEEQEFDFESVREAKTLQEAAEILIFKDKPSKPSKPSIDEKKVELERKLEELKRKEERQREKVSAVKQQVASKNKEQTVTFQLSSNDVVNGIIMSEILGAPRSRKPYRKDRYTN